MVNQNFLKIKQIIEELLKVMDFEGRIELDESDSNFARINIVSPEAKFLIGRNGENLRALQQVGRVLAENKLDQEFSFVIDVNDYQKSQLDFLKETARSLAREVAKRKIILRLAPMNAYERRIVHMELANFAGIKTESEGEDGARRIVIKPAE